MVLEKIKKPSDIKALNNDEINKLASELREFIIEKISKNGGHLASSLGVVELTIALYLSLNMPEDKIIWDVGHQSYAHKILSGRKDDFDELRQFGGISGFPKRGESEYDAFNTGHSSTSISAGLGIASARDLNNETFNVVSVIGDGAMTGGLAFEALNNASSLNSNFIIILNDNNMSIGKNSGGISHALTGLRTSYSYLGTKKIVQRILNKIPIIGKPIIKIILTAKNAIKQLFANKGMLFENLDIVYLGPVDGHDVFELKKIIERAKTINRPVLIHVKTIKGKGYKFAEDNPEKFHGVNPFDIKTGLPLIKSDKESYTKVFANKLCALARDNKKIVAITAAMADGTGLSLFAKEFPNRFYDVGIAEEHAVTFASGLSVGGMIPVVAIYSSFLQRAYDQIIHDTALQNLHVVFAIDRAGLVGADGDTHQGNFDISYLSSIPNMTVLAPKNKYELEDMLSFAIDYKGPIAIRYPRGIAFDGFENNRAKIELGKSEILIEGKECAIFALGSQISTASHVLEKIKSEYKKDWTLVNARFAKPLDYTMIDELCKNHSYIITMEENVSNGGIGDRLAYYVQENHKNCKVIKISLPDTYVEHGDVSVLRKALKIDSDSIIDTFKKYKII